VLGYAVDEFDVAKSRRQHEPEPTAERLFIPGHHGQKAVSIGDPSRNPGPQAEAREKGVLPGHELGRNPPQQGCEPGGPGHPDGHGFTVQERPVARERFVGVGEGVAVVDGGPQAARFVLILGDHVGLDRGGSLDRVGDRGRVAGREGGGRVFEPAKKRPGRG